VGAGTTVFEGNVLECNSGWEGEASSDELFAFSAGGTEEVGASW
jgi:hypothetical protein